MTEILAPITLDQDEIILTITVESPTLTANISLTQPAVSAALTTESPVMSADITVSPAEPVADITLVQPVWGVSTAAGITYVGDYPNVQLALDALFYEAPLITTYGLSVGTVEIGSTVTEVIANWTFNKPMVSATLTDVVSLEPSDVSHTFSGLSLTANKTYTLTGTDAAPATASASLIVSFSHKRYWGASASTTLDSAAILALTSEFSSNNQKTVVYDCTGGKYPYFCYPASWGALSAVSVGGLDFSDYTVTTQDFTNASGNTTLFHVIRFNTLQHGASISVGWT